MGQGISHVLWQDIQEIAAISAFNGGNPNQMLSAYAPTSVTAEALTDPG